MSSMSRVVLIGNLVRAVELRSVGETYVADVSIAVNAREKIQGQWGDVVSYVDCVLWGKTAENAAKFLSKGSKVAVDGRLKQDRWEQDGQKRSKLKVVCDSLQFLDSKPNEHDQRPPASQERVEQQQAVTTGAPPSGEVPF